MIADRRRDALRAPRRDASRCRPCTRRSRSCCRAMAGHLFGYEAALAIDAPARPLREARGCIETRRRARRRRRRRPARPRCAAASSRSRPRFFDGLRSGATTAPRGRHRGAARVAAALRDRRACRSTRTRSSSARSARRARWSKTSPPRSPQAIEELTRPVDAIKHQAKTVTVGISRSDETLLQRAARAARCSPPARARDSLSYRALRTLVDLDPAVDAVTRLHPLPHRGRRRARRQATIHVVDRGGIARRHPVAHRRRPVLRGTKHRVASEREVTVARGRTDGRTS